MVGQAAPAAVLWPVAHLPLLLRALHMGPVLRLLLCRLLRLLPVGSCACNCVCR